MNWRKVRWVRLGVRLLLVAWGLGTLLALAGESFPVEHREPITVRVLDGKSGKPLARARVRLVAGYTAKDLEQKLWRDEVVTDDEGQAQVPRMLGDFPSLQVQVAKTKLCQERSRGETYVVDRIRSEGQNAPNHCGFVAVSETPRVLVVFARGDGDPAAGLQATGTEARVDYAAGIDDGTGREPNELSRDPAQTGRGVDVEAGRALGSVAASVGAREVEAEPAWASLRTRNEIDALMARRKGDTRPAWTAVEGTEDRAASYEEMCQPED